MNSDHPNVTGNGAGTEQALRASELSYRRLFETARDGILILDVDTGRIADVNPFLINLLGFSRDEMVGKTVGEFSPFKDIVSNQAMLERLQEDGHVRYHDLPLETRDGRNIAVEFASNVYQAGDKKVIQCNVRDITGRKKAEEAMRTSERRFQTVADISPVGIFWTDAQGQTIYVNPRWCQITGLSATDALGNGWLRAVHPEDRGKLVQGWQAANQAQGASKVDYRFVHPDGTISWVMGQAVPEKDDAGRIVGYVGTITDITERKQAEAALRDNEAFLNTVIEKIPHTIFVKDAKELRFVKFNQAGRELLGYSLAELAGKNVHDLFPKEMADSYTEGDRQVLRGKEIVDIPEELVLTRDKGERVLHTKKIPVFDNAGQLVYLLGISEDITERKRVEAALNFERELWQTMLDNLPDHIYFKDTQSRFIKVSKVLARRVGLESSDDLVGKTDFDFFTEAHARPAFEDEQEIIRTGQPMIAKEEQEVWKDGHVTWVSSTKMPLRDETGKIVGIMGISRDITKQRQLEEQLRQSQKMEAIGQLAGGVAHDFNNILGVIMGYGDLITEDLEADSPLRKHVEEIRHAAERAAGLTRQLLVFSRKQQVQPVVLDLNGTVKDLDKMLRRLIGENIEMTVVPGKEIGRIKADPGYIGQVLMNLAVNARDAMPNGGKLTIATNNATLDENYTRTHTGVIPGDYVMLTVSDTGTGMTQDVKARMFEALFTTKPSGKGTGLGLATCQTIVQQSGGHIDVDSEVGKGTTFKIYFPRVDKPLAVAAGSGQTGPLPRGTETLLLVEDEASVRHLAWKVLESLGYRVLRANNGQEGLRVARECKGQPVHLVVTDVIMPQMNGKVMAEWLKTTYPEIKVLFTSGYTDDAISQHGVLEPGVAFLPKPYTTATLARKVRAMLDNETDTSILRKQAVTIIQSQ